MEKNEEMRLLDDAFIKICNMVNDICMKVRAEAVGLLGSFHNVSFHLLQQTLDKKLMSHGRVSITYSIFSITSYTLSFHLNFCSYCS